MYGCKAKHLTLQVLRVQISLFPTTQLQTDSKQPPNAKTQAAFLILVRAATIAAYTKAEQWLDELNGVIESNFNLLYSFLRTELPMLNAIRAEGTYLAWIDMRSLGLSDSALEELMLKNYLALDEGYIFGTGGSGFERWNLALPQNELKAALERLKAAVLSLQSKQ